MSGGHVHPDDSRGDGEVVGLRMVDSSDLTPRWLTIHPTDRCNHKCEWCWFERTSNAMSEEALFAVLPVLARLGVVDIAVSGGGEPTLYRGFRDLLNVLEGLTGVRRKLYTNGSRLGDPESISASFDYVRVSIDAGGPEAYAIEHGCDGSEYYRILEGLAIVGMRTAVGVSAVVSERNAETIPQLFADCERFGIPILFLKPVLDGQHRNTLPTMQEMRSDSVDVHVVRELGIYSQPPLEIAALPLLLAPDGFAYPCAHVAEPDFRFGSIADLADGDWVGSEDHTAALRAYAGRPHSCRAFDAWLDYRARTARPPEVG